MQNTCTKLYVVWSQIALDETFENCWQRAAIFVEKSFKPMEYFQFINLLLMAHSLDICSQHSNETPFGNYWCRQLG